MRYWNTKTPLRAFASFIWNVSETYNLPLGRFAPVVFGWIIGSKPHKK